MLQENVLYKDLDLSLTQHPVSGDIIPLINVNAVKRSIRHLFMIDKYDIPFNRDTYSVVKRMLFEPISLVTAGNIQTLSTWLIETHEKRVKLISVEVFQNNEENGYDIRISFNILSLNIMDQMTILLKRVR